MEMERVPKAGYQIEGLDIMGIQRRLTWKNLKVPFKLIGSLIKARSIVKAFKPDVAIGVGGYASGPLLRVASWMGVPTLIQEQNSYPGVTNKLLASKAASICVAYPDMERFFPKEKIKLTGNPVRAAVTQVEGKREEGLRHFGLRADKKTVLIIGGSLGARTVNHAIRDGLQELMADESIQLLWQTGRRYYDNCSRSIPKELIDRVAPMAFIDRMEMAYAAADIIISRAGALSISELCLIAKPAILIPSPNVSEDHQTKNAMALVDRDAAILVKDTEAKQNLVAAIHDLLANQARMRSLSESILQLAKADAPREILAEIHRISTKG